MPEHEVEFFEKAYRDARNRNPVSLGEDFCGTFAVSCQWVKSDTKRTAVGIDTCSETLEWGRNNNLSTLSGEQRERVTLLQEDVRVAKTSPTDILAVQNFSFYFFKTRKELIDYFSGAMKRINDDGIMVLDMMGGAECRIEGLSHNQKIREGKDGFNYIWKQVSYNPINSDACCSISFTFADGSRMNDAFVYHWRIWTIAEVREILDEIGFRETFVYWAVDEENLDLDSGQLAWERRERAPSDASWTCYLVAVK